MTLTEPFFGASRPMVPMPSSFAVRRSLQRLVGTLLRALGLLALPLLPTAAPSPSPPVWLNDPAAYAHVLAADVPAATVALMASVAPPIVAHAFNDKVSHAAWRDKPTWYLLTEQDNALPIAVQRRISEAMGAHRVAVASSHMSLVSHPADVARLIEQATKAAARDGGL